jgi:hypothetical protein
MRAILLAATLAVACAPAPRHPSSEDPPDIAAHDPAPIVENTQDAPEISRSGGAKGGFVLLWPRINPRTKDPVMIDMASFVQQRLKKLSDQASPGAAMDLRPEPERVCPKPDGCAGTAVGALVLRQSNGCAVLALVSAPGQATQKIIPWVGAVKLKQPTVAFRDPPESAVAVQDWVPCDKITASLATGEADVVAAIKAAHY